MSANSSVGSAHASVSTTLSVSSTVSQTTGMVFRSTMSSAGSASTHRDTADNEAARGLEATAGEEGGSSIQFTIDVPMDYTISGGTANSVNADNPEADESIRLRGPTGALIEDAETGQGVGGSGLLPAGHYDLTGEAFMNLTAGEPNMAGGSKSASGGVGFDVTFTLTPAVDSDGDGLPDSWETNGLDVDGDGTVDVDLPAMGADPMHKDVFMEIDAMAGHELERRRGRRRRPGVRSRSGLQPRRVDRDRASCRQRAGLGDGPDDRRAVGRAIPSRRTWLTSRCWAPNARRSYNWRAFDAIKAAHFDPDRRPVFHYVVVGPPVRQRQRTTPVASRAGIGASDLIVSLGFCVPDLASDCTDAPTRPRRGR